MRSTLTNIILQKIPKWTIWPTQNTFIRHTLSWKVNPGKTFIKMSIMFISGFGVTLGFFFYFVLNTLYILYTTYNKCNISNQDQKSLDSRNSWATLSKSLNSPNCSGLLSKKNGSKIVPTLQGRVRPFRYDLNQIP